MLENSVKQLDIYFGVYIWMMSQSARDEKFLRLNVTSAIEKTTAFEQLLYT